MTIFNFNTKRVTAFASLFFMMIQINFAQDTTTKSAYRVINKIKIPDKYIGVKQVILSPNGMRVAYTLSSSNEKLVQLSDEVELFLDGKTVSPLSWGIKCPRFSPDGENLIYISVNNSKDRFWKLCLNNEYISSLYASGDYSINSDGSNIYFIALKDYCKANSGSFIMANDKVLVDEVDNRILNFAWNWDYSQIAYKIGSQFNIMSGYKSFCIKQNKQKVSPDLPDVSPPVFAPHSDKPSYAAKEGKTWSIYSGSNKITQDFEKIDTFIYSPDGKHLAYKAKDKSGWFIFLDGEKISAEVGRGHIVPIFSSDGSKLMYRARVNGKSSVFAGNQKVSPDFDRILTDPIFSPDGSHFAYIATMGENYFVMINDKKISPDYTKVRHGLQWLPEITLIGFNNEGLLVYKVEFKSFSSGALDPPFIFHSFLMINDKLVSPEEDTFIVGDAKITSKGLYFAGYNRIKSTSNGITTKQTWDANIYHCFVAF